ncbi:hypothetical protein GM1_002_01460 [Gordonia malaquae NBRC 108250]|uniref:Uncharacterized protein n=1 Tax=Gordonia malaquae NBRC 108250 TaxID=1223542 RepID=M3V9R0_GORML|nr:hypothetical protein GM1_002_01460 [Gordonia malaquae NBRC 108250]
MFEGEQDLGERRERLRSGRVHRFDDGLERHVGVRERVEVGGADLVEQVGEAPRRVDRGAEDQRVHEHADQAVQLGLTAAGDRCRHSDVVGGRQSGQEHGERSVQDHERGRAVLRGDVGDLFREGLVDREVDHGPDTGRDGRTVPVRGQFEHVGKAVELLSPESELVGDHRRGIGGGAEHVVLPDRDVGHLHRERRECRRDALRPCHVGREHVGDERRHRFAVGRDVVHDDGEDAVRR